MTEAAVSTSTVRLAPNLDAVLDYASAKVDRQAAARVAQAAALPFRARWWAPWALVVTDILALELALLGGLLLRWAISPVVAFELTALQYTGMAVGLLVLPLRHTLDGLYPGYGLGPVERLRRRVCGVAVLITVLICWDFLAGYYSGRDPSPVRGVLIGTLAFAVVICPLAEAATRWLLVRLRCWGIPVAVLGAGRTGELILKTLEKDPSLGLVPVGVFDDDPHKWRRPIRGVPVLGPVARVKSLAKTVRVALVAMPGMHREQLTLLSARLPFPRVILVPDLMGLSTVGIAACDLSGVLAIEVRKNLLVRRNLIIKRVLDYVLGIPLFIVSLPLFALFAAWIRCVSPGPAFYAQDRVGLGGKTIRVWKLRTMYLDADERLAAHLERSPAARREWDEYFKLKDDPRILPGIGYLLRKTSLDELPQLWNVLQGNMSLVGPRPFPRYHLARFRRDFSVLRRGVLPGITGLWQVTSRSNGNLEAQESCDTYYIRNWSVWMDLHLLARTVSAVLSQNGAY